MLRTPFYSLLLAAAMTALLSAAEPRVDQAQPQGLQRGEQATVVFLGPRLGIEPSDLLCYEPGIQLEELESINKTKVKATLRVAEDCRIGRHAVRLRTTTGLSNLVTLHVGALELIEEIEPNNTFQTAQALPLDRTVSGIIKPEDEDTFSIEVVEGQRLSIEVEGLRLGRTFFDPVIEVFNKAGALIAANDDQPTAHSDAYLSLIAPESGKLLVRLRESAYRGDGKSTYLLHVGDFPRPTAVFPPLLPVGEEARVRWIGDASGDLEQMVSLPTDSQQPAGLLATDDRGVAPSSVPVRRAGGPVSLEVEPNNKQAQATVVTPNERGEIFCAGTVNEPGDIDHVRFTAKKKQTFELRVHARRLRSPLDPVLRIYDSKGKRLDGNDDDRGYPDSYLRFVAPADGDYVLQIEDLLKRGGETYVYTVEATRPRPTAEIKLDERRRYQATVLEVPRGGRTNALLTVTRRDFGGDLNLVFDNLPPGVTAESSPLAGNYNRVPVVFTATEDANLAADLSPVRVELTATDQPTTIESRFEQQEWLVRGRNNRAMWSHFARRAPVAVTKQLPFSVELVAPKAPLCRNGSMDLRVIAERDEGFDQAIAVQMLYNPPGVSSNRSRSVTKGKTEAIIPVTANNKARTGEWPIVMTAETNLEGRVYASTQFVTLNVVEPYFDLAVPTVTSTPGKPAEMLVKLSPRTAFEGAAELELMGLPPGVTAEKQTIESGAESAVFQLTIAETAKVGRHRGVGVRVRLTVEGEPVVYRQGYAELRIDPPTADRTARQESRNGGQAT